MTRRPNPQEKATHGEAAENLDDAATVLEGLDSFEKIAKGFDREEIGLTGQYPNRWVAFGADGVERVGGLYRGSRCILHIPRPRKLGLHSSVPGPGCLA